MSAVEDVRSTALPGDATALVGYAILAPSSYNTQPWRFRVRGRTVRIFPDRSRRLPVADPDDRQLFISLGCALENLVIAAGAAGYEATVTPFPREEADGCLRVDLVPGARPSNVALAGAIALRRTNRHHYDGRPIPPADLALLSAVPAEAGVGIRLLTEAQAFDTAAELVRQADQRQLEDEAFRQELVAWIRFNAREASAEADGLVEVPEVPRLVGQWGLRFVRTGDREAVRDERLVRSSSALALFTTAADDRPAWVAAGRSFERFALTATRLGVQLAHVNQPCQVPSLRGEVTRRLDASGHAQLLVRLGYAPPAARSPRRNVEAVLVTDGR